MPSPDTTTKAEDGTPAVIVTPPPAPVAPAAPVVVDPPAPVTKPYEDWAAAAKTPLHILAGAVVFSGWSAQRAVTKAQYDQAIADFKGLSFGHKPVNDPNAKPAKKVTLFDSKYVGAPSRSKRLHGAGKGAPVVSSVPAIATAQKRASSAVAAARWNALKDTQASEKPKTAAAPAKAAPPSKPTL